MRKNTTKTSVSHLLLIRLLYFSGVVMSFALSGQVYDDFSDGNFNENPQWLGDTTKFIISNSSAIPPELKPSLKLNGIDADTSILYLSNSKIQNTEWRFWIKLSFNTSANNYARFYLVSDQPDLEASLNGYFLQVGGTNDSVGLFKQNGLLVDTLIICTNTFTGFSTNILRVKVTHDDTGLWNIYTDSNGGYNFIHDGYCFDNTWTSTSYVGIYCKYTSSNAGKFYFDDIYVNDIINDTTPPEVSSVFPLSSKELEIIFSEEVEISTALDTLNYFINQEIGYPYDIEFDQEEYNKIHLFFNKNFQDEETYQLLVSNISDLSGNEMLLELIEFEYHQLPSIDPYAILINEIMADFSPPPTGLPEADYIELYNPATEQVTLQGLTIQPRQSSDPLLIPDVNIEADSFLLIVHNNDVESLLPFGQVIGIAGFSLNNEGRIILRDQNGKLVHAIEYTTAWYRDEDKATGGWALEQIDPLHPCSGKKNWRASFSNEGGTPGSRNAVDGFTYSIPEIISVQTIAANKIRVLYSHIMDSIHISDPANFYADGGLGIPINAYTDDFFFNCTTLEFADNFIENEVYILTVTDSLQDCIGEAISLDSSVQFVLPSKAKPFEIVINEIMADPNPPVGIPEFEYMEIFNTTELYLEMYGWTLEVGTVIKTIPDVVISPGEYLIFTDDDVNLLFSVFGRVVGFSSLGLPNSGGNLKLKNSNGEIISAIDYSSSWFNDELKEEGGYSLEQVDPFNPCAGEENWLVTMEEKGGTPGEVNSVDAHNPVEQQINKVIVRDEYSIDVHFNQMMNPEYILEPSVYSVGDGIGSPEYILLLDSIFKTIQLHFSKVFSTGNIYQLYIEKEVENCSGIRSELQQSFKFGVHENVSRENIVINEVLFNPVGDGVDFVELYNRSEKIINIRELKLGNVNTDLFGIPDTTLKKIEEEDQLILPGTFLLLSGNSRKVKSQYFTESSESFIDMDYFPSYNNSEGIVVLTNTNGLLVDFFNYKEEMHHPLLTIVEGVSLERIHYNRPSVDPGNWHSASSLVGFATPGYQNSQYSAENSFSGELTLDPEIFSPDNDGFNDIVHIHYNFESPGFLGRILIYDSQGRLIRILMNNELLGSQGTFSWNGVTEDNQKANMGIYIIYFEVFDLKGKVKKFKETVVLAGGMGSR